MCWIIPVVVGLVTVILGYFLGKAFPEDNGEVTRLSEENSDLRNQLTTCEISKAELIVESENLAAQRAENQDKIDDHIVKSHPSYKALLDKYQKVKNAAVSVPSETGGDQHPNLAQLSEENARLTAQLSKQQNGNSDADTDISSHPEFIKLQQQYDESNRQKASIVTRLEEEKDQLREQLKVYEEQLEEAQKEQAGAINLRKVNTLNQTVAKINREETPTSETSHDSVVLGLKNANSQPNDDNFDAETAKKIFGKTIYANDLTIIDGIGPKIAELMNQTGITTWEKLGNTSVKTCREILRNAGGRFAAHNPQTWPRQAKLAAQGQWQALFDWQKQLDGGRETT
ncbi:MAG: hypothetical protein CSA45_04095 [Gammaproteobacteria bacterium]|nr:MAG: hypothetical protein CSA45_04095 [Gammaproteobacteria bacterium]